MLKFNIHFNNEKIEKQLQKTCSKAETIVALQAMADTSEFVPALNGVLDRDTHIENGNTIVYPGPYAQFLYHGKVMVYAPTGSPFAPKDEHKVVTGRDLVMHKTMHPLATSHWFEVSKAMNIEQWEKTAQDAIEKEYRNEG